MSSINLSLMATRRRTQPLFIEASARLLSIRRWSFQIVFQGMFLFSIQRKRALKELLVVQQYTTTLQTHSFNTKNNNYLCLLRLPFTQVSKRQKQRYLKSRSCKRAVLRCENFKHPKWKFLHRFSLSFAKVWRFRKYNLKVGSSLSRQCSSFETAGSQVRVRLGFMASNFSLVVVVPAYGDQG